MAVNENNLNRAVVYAGPPTIRTEIVELPISTPGPGEVLVRLLYSGVCHTDYGFCTNGFSTVPLPTPKGQIGGHEGVGKVVSQGQGVTFPKLGATVGITWTAYACLSCDVCLAGGETSCPQGKISGYLSPGTFQQYIVSPAALLIPIPSGIDLAGAAPLMCGGVSVYTALKRAGAHHGEWIVVSGAGGGLGHLAVQYARALGARVVAIDHGSKKEFCFQCGAEAFVDFTEFAEDSNLASHVRDITGDGAKTVLVCSASNRAYAQAVSFLGFRGVLACLGVPEGKPVPIAGANVGDMVTKELTIFANKSGNRLETKECLEIAAMGKITCHYQLKPADSLTEVFEDMEAGRINGRIVLDLR